MFWEKFFLCGFSLYTFLFFGLFHCIIHIQTSIILTVVLFLFLSIFVVENYELEIIKSKNNRKEIHNMCVILFVSNNQSFVGKNQKEKQIIYYISHPHTHTLIEWKTIPIWRWKNWNTLDSFHFISKFFIL